MNNSIVRLRRTLDEGWLIDSRDDQTTLREKRPLRRYYKLTDKGRLVLNTVL